MPSEDASPTPVDTHKGPGTPDLKGVKPKNAMWAKYKWWFIGGGLILAAIVFYAIRSSNAASNTTAAQQAAQPADSSSGDASSTIDPLTGDISGTPQDLADLQSLYGGGGSSSTTTPTTTTPTTTGNTQASGWFKGPNGEKEYYSASKDTVGYDVGKGKNKKWTKVKL